jgi:hypothetical protein
VVETRTCYTALPKTAQLCPRAGSGVLRLGALTLGDPPSSRTLSLIRKTAAGRMDARTCGEFGRQPPLLWARFGATTNPDPESLTPFCRSCCCDYIQACLQSARRVNLAEKSMLTKDFSSATTCALSLSGCSRNSPYRPVSCETTCRMEVLNLRRGQASPVRRTAMALGWRTSWPLRRGDAPRRTGGVAESKGHASLAQSSTGGSPKSSILLSQKPRRSSSPNFRTPRRRGCRVARSA